MNFSKLAEKPVVVVFAGHDPTGGAGVQADIEAIASLGCHAATVVTALTVQDTRNVHRFECVTPALITAQAEALLKDIPPAAFKLGMIGSAENAHAIAAILEKYPAVPVVIDPVLAAGGGSELGGSALHDALRNALFPLASLITPNGPEARTLAADADTLSACAQALLGTGCRHVLITGGHEQGQEVISRLYATHREIARHAWPRLPGEFHGSGCTLASAIAALLARGADMASAVDEALAYTWHALGSARSPGHGQKIPDRLFWTNHQRWQRDN
jgi:hydroxymethylpyrimidine/phosphomethylpyrimidine kinase